MERMNGMTSRRSAYVSVMPRKPFLISKPLGVCTLNCTGGTPASCALRASSSSASGYLRTSVTCPPDLFAKSSRKSLMSRAVKSTCTGGSLDS